MAVLVGCGSGPGDMPDIGTVKGVVTLDGEPLADAQVFFYPDSGGREAEATTDASGAYELTYNSTEMGAKLGVNTVRVVTGTDDEDDDSGNVLVPGKPELVPAKYNTESTYKKTVEAGENVIDLDLTTT